MQRKATQPHHFSVSQIFLHCCLFSFSFSFLQDRKMEKLPSEAFALIISKLNFTSKLQCILVCKKWYGIICNINLYVSVCFTKDTFKYTNDFPKAVTLFNKEEPDQQRESKSNFWKWGSIQCLLAFITTTTLSQCKTHHLHWWFWLWRDFERQEYTTRRNLRPSICKMGRPRDFVHFNIYNTHTSYDYWIISL